MNISLSLSISYRIRFQRQHFARQHPFGDGLSSAGFPVRRVLS